LIRKIIKIPNKIEFDQLTWDEFGRMIDAFLDGENDAFISDALSEFTSWGVRNPVLQDLRRDIIDNMLLPAEGEAIAPVNEPWLRALSAKLKADGYP
jgi:hypothetical protein